MTANDKIRDRLFGAVKAHAGKARWYWTMAARARDRLHALVLFDDLPSAEAMLRASGDAAKALSRATVVTLDLEQATTQYVAFLKGCEPDGSGK